MFYHLMRHRSFLIFFGLFVLAPVTLSAESFHSISVSYPGKTKTDQVATVERDGSDYVSLEDLIRVTDTKFFTNPKNRKWVLKGRSETIKITESNPFVLVGKNAYQLILPPIDINQHPFVPLIQFLQTVGPFFAADLSFNQEQRVLVVKQAPNNITAVRVEDRANGTLIHILTTKPFGNSDVSSSYNKDWLNITIYGGQLDTLEISADQPQGIVNQIVSFQFDKSAQISLQLNRKIRDHKVYVQSGEIMVILWRTEKIDDAVVKNPKEDLKRWLIDRIIIDPGHGGKDPGAISKSGMREKDITLDIGKRLKELLVKKSDVEVLMTREKDTYVNLKDRTQFANAKNGKLFISIHANANTNPKIHGFSTYILGMAKTDQAREVAQLENSVIELEESQEHYEEYQNASYILNAIAQSGYMKDSENLANRVNHCLKKWTKNPNLGVYQAGFYVLIGSAMPSILIETGFLSNSYEERLLKTRTFRQKLAEALCESILEFKKEYEKGIG